MPKYYINYENSEDTFDSTDNLEDAIRLAKEAAKFAQAGDPVCIEHNGKNIFTFALMPGGDIAEKAVA